MRKPRALIFDDQINIVNMLENFLTKRGYEVCSYTEPIVCPLYVTCAESCEKLAPCSDVVLTDFRMPRMTGLELLERQSKRDCKIDMRNKVVLSAHIDEDCLKMIKDLGSSFFQKPFKLSELSDWLRVCEERVDLSQPLSVL